MDQESILNRLAEVDDIAERTALLDSICGNDTEQRQQLVSQLERRNLSVSPGDLPTKPPVAGSTVTRSTNLAGQRLGRYEVIEQLGEGGMGVVYLAQQEHPVKRQVAIKVTKPGFESHDLLARFQAERQALAMMDHESIAKVFDAGTTDDGRMYFVMELVHGTPITKHCDGKRLDTSERLQLFIAVCRAIQHAHQKGVVHRDVKPSNVLVVDVDGRDVPKVIDFGLAKALEQQLAPHSLHTQYGQVLGTLEYMSPEQASFTAVDVDTRSDVYSLGVLLYELLTGTTPIGRNRLQTLEFDALLRVIRDEEPARPSVRLSDRDGKTRQLSALRKSDPNRLRERFRGDLDLIALKALAKDRDRRYDSAAALAADVQRFLNDEPIEARSPSAVYLLRKFARRNRALVAGLTAVLVALAAGVAGSTFFAIRAQQAAKLAERQSERAQKQRDLALSTLQDVVFQIQMPLAEIPEAREVRQEMLNGAIAGLKRMAEEFTDDWASSRVMMVAFEDIGDIFMNLGPGADQALEMDHREFALRQYTRAEAIAQQHITEWPDDIEVQYDVAMVYTRLAGVHANLGNMEEAHKNAIEANSLLANVSESDPQRYLGAYFSNCFMLSGLTFLRGDLKDALAWVNQALDIAEKVTAEQLELKEPFYDSELEELRVRQTVFGLLPRVYEDMQLALDQPTAIKHRLLIDRAKYFLRERDHAEAARTLDLLMTTEELSVGNCYNTACRYAQCAEIVGPPDDDPDTDEAALYESYCRSAIKLLEAARAKGKFDGIHMGLRLLHSDGDLDPLREREDFKAFVDSLQ